LPVKEQKTAKSGMSSPPHPCLILSPTGQIIGVDTFKLWEFLAPAQKIRSNPATQLLSVGGTRSGKSVNGLMIGIIDYILRYQKCGILCLRRTFGELEDGLIKDLKTLVPEELYTYHESKKIATFYNGSTIRFGHLADGTERSLHQYLGTGYSFILVDECGQFSWEAWTLLKSRNTVNPGCQPDANGNYPIPTILGTTNPVGPYWGMYRKVFRDGEPAEKVEGARKDKKNRWWVNDGSKEQPEWRCVYNPSSFYYVHSTLLDNPHMMAKQPGLYAELNAMPEDRRQKYLFGAMDGVSGQYFDNFDPFRHVINLRQDADLDKPLIKWENWQPKWIGWDWGGAGKGNHANVVCWFTKALVRGLDGNYRMKNVCYRELAVKGQTSSQLAAQVKKMSINRDGSPEKITAIYFSHEKFAKQMEQHSPADELSRHLRALGLPNVTPATRDRIGRATLTYTLLEEGQLVILDRCTEVAKALAEMVRDDKRPDDVLKVNTDADDVYDAFSYGVFGYLNTRAKPTAVKNAEAIDALKDKPFEQKLAIMRLQLLEKRANEIAAMPSWQRKMVETR
jgi:hypothetical protein